MVEALDYIACIRLGISLLVRFLNAASRGSVIAGNGDANHRAVFQIYGSLHQTLAECAAANDDATVLILHGSADNLGGRGCVFIHEDNQVAVHELAAACGAELLKLHIAASAGIDYHVALGQEHAGNLSSRAEISAAVALEVEDERLHPLLFQPFHCIGHLVLGCGSERAEADETNAGFHDICGVERLHGNLVARHLECVNAIDSAADDAEIDFCALRTAQTTHNLLAAHLHTGDGCVVDRHDAVAGYDADLLRRASGYGLNHNERVFKHIKLHSDAVEVALQRLVQFLGVLRVSI